MTTPIEQTEAKFLRVPIESIYPDADQPRKTFDEAQLKELASTIEAHGIIVPLELRPHPKKNHGSYLLVAGERRWRAAKLVGLKEVPAIVKTLTDKEALEHQLLENAQRVDVPAIEEGEAYKALCDEHGYTMEMLVQKTGRSRSHLYDRIKLTKLAPAAKKALIDGKLETAIAELASRIHDPKLQERFVKECLGHGQLDAYREANVEGERLEDDKGDDQPQPLSFRAALQLLRRRYMLRLEVAKFDIADATLTKAGACTTCPKRSGNQPELPGMTGAAKADDLCTDPTCFADKTKAAWTAAAAIAKAKDMVVLDQKKAAPLFGWRGELRDEAPVVALDTELPWNVSKPGKRQTFGKLLGKEIANVPKALVQDPNGAPVELLDKAAALKKLREMGKLAEAAKPKSSGTTKAQRETLKKANDKAQLDADIRAATLVRVLGQAAAAAAKDIASSKETAFWRWFARSFFSIDEMEYGENLDEVGERRDVGAAQLDSLVDKLKTAGELRALVVECLLCRDGSGFGNREAQARYADGLKLFGVDVAKAAAAAKEAVKAEAKNDAAKEQKADAKGKAAATKKGGRQ